jgi:hypothetical protein
VLVPARDERTDVLKPTGKSLTLLTVPLIILAVLALPALAGPSSFIGHLHRIRTLAPTAPKSGPAKGDINPYGVAVVPVSTGRLVKGDVLVSNFNNAQNQQGTGSSIVEVSRQGGMRVFAVVPRPTRTRAVGLTTALVALRSGFVVVGSLPAPGGMSSHARAGALTILNSHGSVVKTIRGGDINGPWDMTAVDHGRHVVLFVTNVLNGTVAAQGRAVKRGTVVRIKLLIAGGHPPKVTSNQVVASGFGEHTDPNALVVGPTGVGLAGGTLYVADAARNRIAAVPQAMTRTTSLGRGGNTVSEGGQLNDPLGLTIAPDGAIVTANGGDGKIVETTPGGRRPVTKTLVRNGAGDLFGLAVVPGGRGLYFVDDAGSGPAANSLRLLR